MASQPPETPRPRSSSSTTSFTSPPPSSRRRPPPSVLSPLSGLSNASPAVSLRSSTYQSSVRSPESVSGNSLAPSRFRTFSAAASQAGSIATTASPGGPARLKRGHARKRPGQPPIPPPVRTNNPDEVDLMALEEPDEVFRMFGVRDVRKIEQRASDAANAKVAELRTMVGERYRDLLAAADSIVRMRSAAEKLVDKLDTVQTAVSAADSAAADTPTKQRPTLQNKRQRSNSPTEERTLASSATLSFTIHLLLTIPSLVHSLVDSSDFLLAARLEDLGRLVYRELSQYSAPAAGGDDDEEPPRLQESFPIIEKQWEILSALRPVVLRNALGDLKVWDAPPSRTAQTVAAIVMLQETTTTSALSTFLDARSHTLDELLRAPSISSNTLTPAVVTERLEKVLGLILRTVEAVSTIFGGEGSEGVLAQLLRQVEQPGDAASPVPPIFTAFPNYSTVQRHLPDSILRYSPTLAASQTGSSDGKQAVSGQLEAWLSSEVERVVSGISSWISTLCSPAPNSPSSPSAGAKPLSHIRLAVRRILTTAEPSSSAVAKSLQSRLEGTIETLFADVYRSRLSALVSRVQPSLQTLLLALPDSEADRDTAKFLFDTPLAFPSAGMYVSRSVSTKAAGADPFEAFLGKVGKRVEGRSPLLDTGLTELEDAARDLRTDLEDWLGEKEDVKAAEDDHEMRARLRKEYLSAAEETLKGVADALDAVLAEVADDVGSSLFVGNFAFLLSSSRTCTRDLLLSGDSPQDLPFLSTWSNRLSAVQSASLETWRSQAVARAVGKIQESMNAVAAAAPGASLWAWDASRAASGGEALLPSSPSSALLSALRSLSSSIHRVGLHRTQSDPSIAFSLLTAFAEQARDVAGHFAEVLEKGEVQDNRVKREVAAQVAWDLALVGRLVSAHKGAAGTKAEFEDVKQRFFRLVSSQSDTLASRVDESALQYLQRTQSILAALLPYDRAPSAQAGSTEAAGKAKTLGATARLLPLGQADSGAGSLGDFKSTSAGLVKPGPRLGLLPTRG
ncbi:Vps51/Vps67 domain-containing protein [Rhodotorula toruloides ATCC 204091]|uniref:Conserved oligomeric Golgi complex subunit 1 n=1 Tax=Rhodotorula toruloides TaxID=5286 RepID=A0A0K3CHF3_RHOTO|nr:Vps51/Vps67 domain-containing protein [Rhodotorula toruloides ATCC 204091]KAK4332822.1 Conserved oligomeric Golgi complex subunit 1 [Rhodotorula toruloides]PRQ73846.1 Vps51/Vps67 domain-containing protein [Rhodotorula toruloides]